MTDEQRETLDEFKDKVNMTASELEDWLETEESKNVGQEDASGEAIGHRSGREIVKILNKNQDEYTEANFERMNKVVGYINRHLAQKPDGDIEETNWRYSLMNWGHDPMK